MKVPVLFCAPRSVYKKIACADAYDQQRDAMTYRGDAAVVAHPPCADWGRMRRRLVSVDELGPFAVETVQRVGGVLEHPACSSLWKRCNLPVRGVDRFGGRTFVVNQSWFGHPAEKSTWLYIVGAETVPDYPFDLAVASRALQSLSRVARDATPYDFAEWLLVIAYSIEFSKSWSGWRSGGASRVEVKNLTSKMAMGG